jgi:hypothetical protein
MKKPWSVTTTLRNPERLRDFLIVLKQLENCKWDLEHQRKYQILLIKERIYGYGSSQFYNGLSQDQIDLIDDSTKTISYEQAEKIFDVKKYEDSPMRGRQSINPLKKFGFVVIQNEKINITSLGKLFLNDNFDLGEIFFRNFIKWQIPNPDNVDYKFKDGYDIKPFISILHLIQKVKEKSLSSGEKVKGISKEEFSLFCPTLVDYKDIDSYSNKIIELRKKLKGKIKQEQKRIWDNYKSDFAQEFLNSSSSVEIQKLLKNLKDYGDNAIRYFRLTRYIYIRGGGFYIDLEPRRTIEIKNLLSFDNAQSKNFASKVDYLDYISDITQPILPWETKEKLSEIAVSLLHEIKQYESKVRAKPKSFDDFTKLNENALKEFINYLRSYRRELQDQENHQKSQEIEQIKRYIEQLENIFDAEYKPILLEKLLSLGFNALNDALRIKPNYPVGDDNEPTFTAPANMPDIECFYENYNAICEVTMLTGRNQWYYEGQPVMRHLRNFEKKYLDKNSYCLFIAPKLHRDTINTFWTAIKYEYEGQKQKIVPLSIKNFIELLKILIEIKQRGKFLNHREIFRLYDEILDKSIDLSDSNEWIKNIPNVITAWGKSLNY